MRIAYSTDHSLPRSTTDAEQAMSMVAALGRCGAEVVVLEPARWLRTPARAEELAAFYEVAPAFSVAALRGLTPSFRGLEKVAHAVAVSRSEHLAAADVLCTRNLPTVIAALSSGRSRVIYETYRPWPRQRPRTVPLFRHIFRHPRFLGAVLHSELAAESYRALGSFGRKILVAHNGYEPDRLEPVLGPREAREQLGLPREQPIVVYAGHISVKKGLGLVLDLAEAYPSVLFVLVGSKASGPIERRAAGLENVRIQPWQPFAATAPYLYSADVLLIPPTRAPLEDVGNTVLPMKTFLYMAAGRPILAPATPDLQEVLADGVSARLVRPDDVIAAGEALGQLLGDGGLRERLGSGAREAVAGWTWTRRAERVLRFVEERLQDG